MKTSLKETIKVAGKGEFWEKFCIIVPSAWVGYAIYRYRNNEKL